MNAPSAGRRLRGEQFWLLAILILCLSTLTACGGARAQTFTYREPFGISHTGEILEFDLAQPVAAGANRLLDAKGREVPYQLSLDGKKLLLLTDLAAGETLTWKLAAGRPAVPAGPFVTVSEDAGQGWYEISNGVTGVRVPNGKTFTDETAGLTPDELAQAAQNGWELEQARKKHGIVPSNPAPVQGLRLRDGRWTANGPSLFVAEALCSGMKVEFLARGPIETVVRVRYDFKAKPPAAPYAPDPSRNPGYPGGDGHYLCTIKLAAGRPVIEFEEDCDRVATNWRMNLWPELNFDTLRHPGQGANRPVVIEDLPVTDEAFAKWDAGLRPFGEYPFTDYYYLLFDSKGDAASPVVAAFVDKSGNAVGSMASGAKMVLSDNWADSGRKGGGFNKVTVFGWPDARVWPLLHQKWGIFVGTKGQDLPPLDKPQQTLDQQMNLLAARVPQLRNVTAKIPELPQLNWEERSDWINVKAKFGAVGDGKADDTAALQAALDSLKDGYDFPNTLYFPPGAYRITATLHWKNLYSKHLLGHGRDTRIVWDGPDGSAATPWTKGGSEVPSVMFHSDGATAGVIFEGIVWDGAGKAAIGVNHCSSTHYESHVIHRNEEFVNLAMGVVTSASPWFKYVNATAEVMFDNCLFVNDGQGLVFGSYNALDNTVTGCGFYYCTNAVNGVVGNVYVRDSHFEGSLDYDISGHCGATALRCTSVGSNRFAHDIMPVIEDCHVEGWKSPRGAIQNPSAPLTIFDCTFTNPPNTQPPVQGLSDTVLISNCRSEGTEGVLPAGYKGNVVEIPPGKRGPAVTSARQTFFRSEVAIPGKVFDVKRDFGAIGDGKADDTEAVLAAIKAARENGKGALAYLPCGQFRVTKTIEVFGKDYYIGGAGMGWGAGTVVTWGGPSPAAGEETALFHVKNADRVTLQGFVAGPPYPFEEAGMYSFLQEASDGPSLVTYDNVNGMSLFRGLGKQDRVFLKMLGGVVDIDNCQRATILAEQIYPGRHPSSKRMDTTLRVRGKDQALPKDGFLGLMTMFNAGNPYDIKVEDSQNLVISDYYTEQTWRVLLLEGNAGDTPGRVTILAHKFHGEHVDDLVNVRNYRGALFLGASPLPQVPVTDPAEAAKAEGGTMAGVKVKLTPFVFSHQGTNPIDIMLVGCSYGTGEPVLNKEAGATFILANDLLNGKVWHPGATEEEKRKISAALDDLRELGAVDLSFKATSPAAP